MASLQRGYSVTGGCYRHSKPTLGHIQRQLAALRINSLASGRKSYSTEVNGPRPGEEIQAAPEVDIEELKSKYQLARFARPVPVSPSYFSRRSQFNDSYIRLYNLYSQYKNLPLLQQNQVERIAWKNLADFRVDIGERVKATLFSRCMEIVKALHRIHPKLKPQEVKDALEPFKRTIQHYDNVSRTIPIDKFGRALGVGKRKTSVARAWVVEGNGEVQVNGKTLAGAFGRVHDRESAVWALRATGRIDKYNVWSLVDGGGTTGQAEALTLAIAKALVAHEPALKPALRRAGCMTRDSRKVERKKHGHVKARKMPAWVKR